LLKGTLDMLILRALTHGPRHGYGIARWIEERSGGALRIEEGSLYPALHRMNRRGWVQARWGVTEGKRRARFYKLTLDGRTRLRAETSSWKRLVATIGRVLREQSA
jgi:transcriptional regulator